MHPELQRIADLPTGNRGQAFSLSEEGLRRGEADVQLRPIQLRALGNMMDAGGLVGAIGVGLGKTLIAFLAGSVLGCRQVVVFMPAGCVAQAQRMYADYRRDWDLPPIHILSYARLSQPSGTNLLAQLRPDLIVADEAHLLKRLESARTKRIVRHFREHPTTRFVALSGTMTSRSILDYSHLAELALRERSPLPRDRYTVQAWARVLDAGETPAGTDWQHLAPIYRGRDQQEARAAFRDRFTATPGVVCSAREELGVSLRLAHLEGIPFPTLALCNQIRDTGRTPDGVAFATDLAEWACLRQLALGFFYGYKWPGEVDQAWLDARNYWSSACRQWLSTDARANRDSPLLVSQAIDRGEDLPASLVGAWTDWKLAKQRPGPTTVDRWPDPEAHALRALLRYADGNTLIWYESDAVARWLVLNHYRVIRAGEPPPEAPDGRPVALSIRSHGQGLNLQAWAHNLVLEPPSSGKTWEQLIGRTHRMGQTADSVVVLIATHVPVFRRGLRKARREAEYVNQTQGQPQRLLYADYTTERQPNESI